MLQSSADASNNSPWFILRFSDNRNGSVDKYLSSNSVSFFIPALYCSVKRIVKGEAKERRVLKPVFRHLLFIRKDRPEDEMRKLLSRYPFPLSLYRDPATDRTCEISDNEMTEFRMFCDPNLLDGLCEISEDVEQLVGVEVILTKGPFKGMTGILKRKKKAKQSSDGAKSLTKQYYVMKAFGCAMVKVQVMNGMFKKLEPSEPKAAKD